jgi:predicted nucleic acid-binding Zn ribbon protein
MFQRLSRYLPRAIRRSGIERQVEDSQILEQFQSEVTGVLGHSFQPHIRPISVRNGVLTVAVEKPVVAQELQWKSATLLERVNAHFGRPVVTHLQIVFQGREEGIT